MTVQNLHSYHIQWCWRRCRVLFRVRRAHRSLNCIWWRSGRRWSNTQNSAVHFPEQPFDWWSPRNPDSVAWTLRMWRLEVKRSQFEQCRLLPTANCASSKVKPKQKRENNGSIQIRTANSLKTKVVKREFLPNMEYRFSLHRPQIPKRPRVWCDSFCCLSIWITWDRQRSVESADRVLMVA